jgi:hypothetical protein
MPISYVINFEEFKQKRIYEDRKDHGFIFRFSLIRFILTIIHACRFNIHVPLNAHYYFLLK